MIAATNTVTSHEYAEAATDPLLNAWVDSSGNEIGDLCAPSVGIGGVVAGVAVQMLWDDITSRCVTYAASTYVKLVQADTPNVFYRLGETSGTFAASSQRPSINPSNNNNGGTYTQTPSLGVPGGVSGDPDTAVVLSGGAQVTSPGLGLPALNTPRTVEAWIKTTATPVSQSVIAYGSQANGLYFMMSIRNGGTTLHFDGWSDNVDFTLSTGLADGKWHLLAMTYGGTNMITAYVDAQQVGQKTLPGPLSTNEPGMGLFIGGGNDGSFNGSIDKAAIYPTALLQAKFQSHYGARNWQQQTPGGSPSARLAPSMAYDAATSTLLLFGGTPDSGSTFLNDTWSWDGTVWTQMQPAGFPSPRMGAAMAYDTATRTLLLFGGSNGGYFNDTWSWNGSTWSQLHPAHSPSARSYSGVAYDAAISKVVLFGGRAGGSTPFNDTWLWNGSDWTQSSKGPSGRIGPGMTYDPVKRLVVLFGGQDALDNSLNDTWTWNGTSWKQSATTTKPSIRYSPAFDYDATIGRSILFGGFGSLTTYYNDTWAWDGTNWAQQTPIVSPPSRGQASFAFDAATQQAVLFGGRTPVNGEYGDTWTY